MKIIPWTEDDVRHATNRNSTLSKRNIAKALEYLMDNKKIERFAVNSCAYCYYYRDTVAGQGFTDWKCQVCGDKATHPNTNVPRICNDCCNFHSLCHECGGDIHERIRRKGSLK